LNFSHIAILEIFSTVQIRVTQHFIKQYRLDHNHADNTTSKCYNDNNNDEDEDEDEDDDDEDEDDDDEDEDDDDDDNDAPLAQGGLPVLGATTAVKLIFIILVKSLT